MQSIRLSSGYRKRKQGGGPVTPSYLATSKRSRQSTEVGDSSLSVAPDNDSETLLQSTQDPFQAAEYALRGIAKVRLFDITFKRTQGSPQRPIYSGHVNELVCLMMNKSIGVRRTSKENYIILSAPQAAILRWEEIAGVKLSKDYITDVPNFFETTNCQFEIQDGQHRLSALKQVISTIAKAQPRDNGWESTELWWTAYIFDSSTIDMWDLEFLRMNFSSHNKPDTEADVWIKLDAMQAYANNLEVTSKSRWKDLESQVLALNTMPRRFKEVYDGRWSLVIRRLLQYPAYHEDYYSDSLRQVNVQRCRFFWKQFFKDLEGLLVGITRSQPGVLTVETLDLLRKLKTPRSVDKIEALYSVEIGPKRVADRSQTLLSTLDDDGYYESAVFLSRNYSRIGLPKWDEILRFSRVFGNLIDSLCFHICRWVDPESMNEHQAAQNKPSVEEVWEGVLRQDGRVEFQELVRGFGEVVTSIVRRHEKTFRKAEYKQYLDRETIRRDTATYRERFSCPPWALLLQETVKVFGAPRLKHLLEFDISLPGPLPRDLVEDMAQAFAKLIKRSAYLELNPSLISCLSEDASHLFKCTAYRWEKLRSEEYLHANDESAPGDKRLVSDRLVFVRKVIKELSAEDTFCCRDKLLDQASPGRDFSTADSSVPFPISEERNLFSELDLITLTSESPIDMTFSESTTTTLGLGFDMATTPLFIEQGYFGGYITDNSSSNSRV